MSRPKETGPVTPVLRPPDKPILFQPKFSYADSTTHQGTGFFVRAPNGKVAAITSAHFLRRDGQPLLKAEWLDIQSGKPVATLTKSWGQPGNRGSVVDARPDYLVMPVEEDVPEHAILELDPRPTPEKGERVWFPDKDPDRESGYRLVDGKVYEGDPTSPVILLEESLVFQSQSGSPVISQTSGKVVGTLSKASSGKDASALVLCPSSSLLQVLQQVKEFPRLDTVIGK